MKNQRFKSRSIRYILKKEFDESNAMEYICALFNDEKYILQWFGIILLKFCMKLEFHEFFFVILTVIVFSVGKDFRYFMECLQINKTVNFDIKELILSTFPT
jgi:hypothetical protein